MVTSTILKNEIALDYAFQPKQLPYRKEQYKQIIKIINSFESGKTGINILAYGYPDIGKSHAIRSIIQDYIERIPEIFAVYVNCWSKNTSDKIISEICDIINYKKANQSFHSIKNFFRKRPTIFIFDKIENLIDFEILEVINKNIVEKVLILITDNKQFFDDNIQSMLKVKNIEFKPYSLKEIRGVFKQRLDFALYPNVLANDAFDLITKKSFEISNIKIGLFILREACTEAEIRCVNKITKSDIQKAIDNHTKIK